MSGISDDLATLRAVAPWQVARVEAELARLEYDRSVFKSSRELMHDRAVAAEAALATSNDLLAESRRMYALRREGQEAAEAALAAEQIAHEGARESADHWLAATREANAALAEAKAELDEYREANRHGLASVMRERNDAQAALAEMTADRDKWRGLADDRLTAWREEVKGWEDALAEAQESIRTIVKENGVVVSRQARQLATTRQALAEIAAVHRPNMDTHERDIARHALAEGGDTEEPA